jgi:uncharacterized damage-inducible protein DinB
MAVRAGFVLFVWMAAYGVPAGAQESPLLGPLKQQWETIRANVVRTAEAVPEDKYDFKPTPEVRSFRDQFIHIVEENYFFMGFVAGEQNQKPANLKTKAEIVKALNDSYDYGAKVLASLNEQKALEMVPRGQRQVPRWSMALANIADNMDHYGNLVVYMRMNGIVPPSSQRR